jgi:LuxR family maltose regulon positive regulatory protein
MGKPLRDLLERSVAQAGEGGGPRSGPAFPKAYAVDLLGAFRREVGRLSASPDAGAHSSSAGEPPIDALTPRELDVLLLLAEGLTNKAIAGKLIVASSTVKQHLKNIYSKLDAHSRTEAVARGRELGYF